MSYDSWCILTGCGVAGQNQRDPTSTAMARKAGARERIVESAGNIRPQLSSATGQHMGKIGLGLLVKAALCAAMMALIAGAMAVLFSS